MMQVRPDDGTMQGAGAGAGGDYTDQYGPPPGAAAPQTEVIGGVYGGTVSGDPLYQPDGSMTGPLRLTEGSTGAVYYEGDQWEILQGLTTEDRTRLQQQMVAIGLASNPTYGEIDDRTIDAMGRLLAMSNRSGTEWESTLSRIATNPAMQEQMAGGDSEPFEAAPYLAPDTATWAQEIKGFMRDRLGREPDEYELAELSSELTGYDRLAHQREQELAELQHGQQTTPGVQDGGEVQSVDPVARFKEFFEKRYANELDFIEERETTGEINEAVGNTVQLGAQMSRGGR